MMRRLETRMLVLVMSSTALLAITGQTL
jgi:hypothetical protein